MSTTSRLATLLIATVACSAPDDRAEPVPPAGAMLEVVLDDSIVTPPDSLSLVSALGGMCLRGDPVNGEAWSVDHVDDTLSVLALDPLEALASRDSARLAARLARTADALPGDTLVADFRGLPVVVRDAWRLVPVLGDTTYIAIASRRLPMESSPLEEQFTLLAMPDSAAGAPDALRASWFARSAGAEDSLETRDPLLAYRTPDGTLRMLLLRQANGAPVIESLARVQGRWRRQRVGTLATCQ